MEAQRGTITQAGEVRSARLESLRALAALAVMEGHIFAQSRNYSFALDTNSYIHKVLFDGGLGVFVFFCLTGYLISWPFVRQWFGEGAKLDLRRYAINRIVRIVPLYVAAVVILLVVEEHGGTGGEWWRFLTFSENYSISTLQAVDGPMWSLVVEVQFYILLPFLVYGLAQLSGRSTARAALILIALAFVSWLVRHHAVGGDVRRPVLEYSLPATFMYFVPGMLVALLRLRWEARRPGWLRGPLASGDWWLVAAVAVLLVQFAEFSSQTLIGVVAFLAVGACVLPLERGRIVRLLDWRPLAALGVASYSLYIWHDPIVTRLHTLAHIPHGYVPQLVIAGAISIAVALVSYRVIEAPFLKLRRQWGTKPA